MRLKVLPFHYITVYRGLWLIVIYRFWSNNLWHWLVENWTSISLSENYRFSTRQKIGSKYGVFNFGEKITYEHVKFPINRPEKIEFRPC